MTAQPDLRAPDALAVPLSAADDFDGWREHARRLVQAGVPPERVAWTEPGGEGATLFARSEAHVPAAAGHSPEVRVPRGFMALARQAALHSDPHRFDLLYRLLWRLQSQPRLMDDAADADVRALGALARSVRRDMHKMRAFVRFRSVTDEDGTEHFVAWFEPEHHILRANARFFVDRFTTMRWSILTPGGSLHWDGETLREGPPARREQAPGADPAEDLWRSYYASIFNPARLKVGAMLKEMPRKYWKNLPEAALIPELVAGAQAREAAMVQAGMDEGPERPRTLAGIGEAIDACRRCPIGCNGTRAVMGEGPPDAGLVIVGEQPGDVEEQEGRPFVGPAGRMLDTHLDHAGIDRDGAYVTNAVKHFKFVQRGKRRLHQSPTAREIDICRWWLEGEIGLVQPRHVLALGASAARALLGRTPSINRERGQPIARPDGSTLWITVHPSFLLRVPPENRAAEEARFQTDLQRLAGALG